MLRSRSRTPRTGLPWGIRYHRDGETGVGIPGCGGENAVKKGPGLPSTLFRTWIEPQTQGAPRQIAGHIASVSADFSWLWLRPQRTLVLSQPSGCAPSAIVCL
jgi:hypothetical protein